MELQLAPESSQLKDSNLMTVYHELVGLPKHGKCAHPDNRTFAFDGRGMTSVAEKGSIDDQQRMGSLLWLDGRTSASNEANMDMHTASVECSHKVAVPAPKK